MAQNFNGARNVLITPVVVDFADTSGRLYRNGEAPPQFSTDDTSTAIALGAAASILPLKRNREGKNSAIDIAGVLYSDPKTLTHAMDGLTQDRSHGLALAIDFGEHAARHFNTDATMIYGFADIKALGDNDPSLLYKSYFMGHTLLVRAEETLAPLASEIAEKVNEKVQEGHNDLLLDGNTLLRGVNPEEQTSIPLRGYTYRRSSVDLNERQSFPDFPSCEVFMAATVLEQLELADNVVRIVPSSMRDREMSARFLLRLLGHTDLPVLSIISSSSGDVQKKIPWYQKPTGYLAEVSRQADAMKAHKLSTQLAKYIHDKRFSEHRALYEQHNLITDSTNIPPSAVLESDLLTDRTHEVFSRTLRAAPLYEANKISKEQADTTVLPDIRLIKQMFDMWHEIDEYRNQGHRPYVRYYPGRGSNSVGYIKAVLATRSEVDPVTISGSKYIQLVTHFVLENVTEELLYKFHDTSSTSPEFAELLEANPPRYALLEARREETDHSPAGPILSPI